MLQISEQALVETIRAYSNDPDLVASEDPKNGTIRLKFNLAGSRRDITFDHIATHDIAKLEDEQRADVIAALFGNAANWPDGRAEVRCVTNHVEIRTMTDIAEYVVFVGDVPVTNRLRLSSVMHYKA